MTAQPTLPGFDESPLTGQFVPGKPDPVKAMSRRSDPQTSHEAAAKHVASGQSQQNRERCIDAVFALYRKGSGGPTAGEVAKWLNDPAIDYYEAARRLPECTEHVVKGPARRCPVRESKCQTWEPKQ